MMFKVKLSKRRFSLFLAFAIAVSSLLSAFPMAVSAADLAPTQASYYVSPTGSDSNDGSIAAPFKTIEKARDVVRTINSGMTGDIHVYLRGGEYGITSTISFGTQDSGTNGYRVYYQAYPGEKPVLNGATKVTGWQQDTTNTNLYKASLDRTTKLRNLYVNDKRASMTVKTVSAKGSEGTYNVTKGAYSWAWVTGSKADGVKYLKTDLPSIASNQDDLEIINGSTWNENIVCVRDMITSVTDSNYWVLRLQQPYGSIAQLPGWGTNFSTSSGASHKIFNAFEFFNAPGQFYFDKTAKTLYYWPRAGENMATADVEAPVIDKLIDIAGTSTSNRVKNITFQGITFENTDWQLLDVAGSKGKATVQGATGFIAYGNGDWHSSKYEILETNPGMINVCSSDSVDFIGNVIKHSGADGLSMVNDVVNSNVTGNYIYDIASSGITVGHPQHVYIGDKGSNPLEKYNVGVEGICKDVKIANNMMYDISTCPGFGGCAGVTAFFVEGLNITYNTIHTTAYNGINLGWGWQNFLDSTTCKNNVVSYNRLYNTLNRLHDSGAIYTLGQMPNTFINENYVKGIPNNSSGPTYGLHNDEGSAYITENDNVLDIDPGVTYTINCEDFGKKHDLTIKRTYATVNKMGKNPPTSDIDTPVEIPDNSWPQAQYNTVLKAGIQEEYKNLLPASLFPAADYVFPAGCSIPVTGTPVQLNIRSGGDPSNTIWFAPAGTTTFTEGPTMTKASGTATSITVPSTGGKYRLFVVNSTADIVGVSSAELKATLPTPELTDIKVNGTELTGFASNTLSYSVALPKSMTTAPTVTAAAKAGTGTVAIVDATSVPGTATVTVSNAVESKVYKISFAYAPTSANFMDGTIDSDWNILNPDPANYSVVAGKGLRLPTQNNDIYSTARTWTNAFLRPAGGDWDITSTAYFPVAPSANYQQQAFLVWQDEDNYIKVDIENSNSTSVKIQFGYEKAASFKSVASASYAVNAGASLRLFLRIKKSGDSYTAYYSKDGINYTSIGTTTFGLVNPQVGLFATKNSSNPVIDTFCESVTVLSASNPFGTVAPTWPVGSQLSASAQTTGGLTLSWPAAQDEKAVTNYKIYNGASIVAIVPGNTLTYDVTGLAPNTSYSFKVEAGDGDDAWSSDGPACTSTTLDTPDVSAPSWPAGSVVTPSAIYADEVALTWPAAQDDKAVTGYKVYNGTDLIATVTDTKYMVTGLTPNTDYTFKVEAGDKAGKWSTNGPSVAVKTNSSYKYEAEKATLSGGAAIATDHTGYTGTGFVGGYYNALNAKTSFSVTVPSAGSYTVTLHYSNGFSASSTNIGLYVNGTKQKNITCPSTGASWDKWSDVTETVTLNGGVNTIDYNADTASTNCINLDNIVITRVGAAAAPTWPQAGTFTAADISTDKLTLSWSPAQDDKAVASYRVYNGKTLITTVSAPAISCDVTGLTPNTSYTFRVEAGDDDGNWAGGPVLTVSTKEIPDTAAPTWPAGSKVTASNVASSSLTLTWTAAQDNKSVTNYKIYNGNDVIATVAPAAANSYAVTGLAIDTEYTFKVEAGDAAGNWSTDGPEITVSTSKTKDTAAPTWPNGSILTVENLLGNSLTLTWLPAQDNVEVTGYRIYKGTDVIATVSGNTTNSYDVTGLTAETTYTFRVEALDAEGNCSTGGPSKTVITNSSIKYEAENAALSGGTVVASNHLGYSGAGFVGDTVNTGAKVSFTVNAPEAGAYTVDLRYSAGNGNKCENMALYVNGEKNADLSCNPTSGWDEWAIDTRNVTLQSGANTIEYTAKSKSYDCMNLDYIIVSMVQETQAPTWPAGSMVTASAIGINSAALSWTPAEDNVGVTSYVIYNGTEMIGKVAGSMNSYDASGLTAETEYTFTVQASDKAGNISTDGPKVTLTTLPDNGHGDTQAPFWPDGSSIEVTETTKGSITLKWPAAQDDTGVTGYVVYEGDTQLAVLPGYTTSYSISNLTPGVEYTYTVKAKDPSSNLSTTGLTATVRLTDETHDSTAPNWPSGSILTVSGVSQTGLSLSWPSAQDDRAVTGYRIYKDSKLLAVFNRDTHYYYVSGLSAGTTYSFTVQAVDAANNWSSDLAASATTSSSGNGSSGSSSGGGSPATPAETATPGKIKVAAPVLDTASGMAKVTVDASALAKALKEAKVAAIEIPTASGAASYAVSLPTAVLASGGADKAIKIATEFGTVVTPLNMLSAAELTGIEKVELSIEKADTSKLDSAKTAAIGDRPVFEVNLIVNGKVKAWSNPNAALTIKIPYKPTPRELSNSEYLTVWYLNPNGKAVQMKDAKFVSAENAMVFTTTHLSKYAVVYTKMDFEDMLKYSWAVDAVKALAADGIIEGTSDTAFSPAQRITRAEYVAWLVRTLGLTADIQENFSDVEAASKYYKEIGVAKALGITVGFNGKFSPEREISRQELASLTINALKTAKVTLEKGTANDIRKYTDSKKIAAYAVENMASMVKMGFITGNSKTTLNPTGATTRAEAAAILYKIYAREQK